MTELISHPYAGEQDLTAMIDIIRSRSAERRDDFPSIVDLEEWTTDQEPPRKVLLWQTERNEAVGYSIVDTSYSSLWFETMPEADGTGLAAEMLQWAEAEVLQAAQQREKAQKNGKAEDEALSLRVSCRDDFVDRIFLLETAGFVADTGYTVHLARSLIQPIPDPTLPPRHIIRALDESEVEAAVSLHRAAFGTEHMTVEGRRSWMTTSDYEPALDLVAVAPDGNLAAYCFCNISHADNALSGRKTGWTDPIATHPDHQRKGLATALISTGLAMLKERSMEEAALGTWSENEAMWKTAEKVGFEVRAKTLFYYKKLE